MLSTSEYGWVKVQPLRKQTRQSKSIKRFVNCKLFSLDFLFFNCEWHVLGNVILNVNFVMPSNVFPCSWWIKKEISNTFIFMTVLGVYKLRLRNLQC